MKTNHKIIIGDSRKMSEIKNGAVNLIITSPPYWQLKDMIRIDADSDITFTFGTSTSVFANINYWLVLSVKKYSDNAGFFRNSWQNAINTGSDLYGSGQAGKGNSGTCSGYCNFTVPYPDAAADWYMKLGLAQ